MQGVGVGVGADGPGDRREGEAEAGQHAQLDRPGQDPHEIDGDPGGDRQADRRQQVHPEGRLTERLEDDRGEPAEQDVRREARRVGRAHERADRLELAGVPERDTGQQGEPGRRERDHRRRRWPAAGPRGSSGDPVLRSDPPSTLMQEPSPVTRPASGGTERGTRAPSRSTGMRGAVGAVVIVLALGLALRLIIAYLLPGSGFGVDLTSFRYWASNLADQGPWGFYGRDFFHDYTPGYLYVLWLVGLVGKAVGGVGRPHQDPADPRRPGHRLAGPLDDPRARRAAPSRPRRRLRRGPEPGQLVRQRRVGPGRLVRRRLPAAGPARAVAGPA